MDLINNTQKVDSKDEKIQLIQNYEKSMGTG